MSGPRVEGRWLSTALFFSSFRKAKQFFRKSRKIQDRSSLDWLARWLGRRSGSQVEGSLRPMRSLVAGQIRSTSTLNPHTPEVEGRGWAQGRESRRLEVKGQAGGSRASVVVEARGWGSGLGLEVQGRRWSLTRLTVSQLFNWGSVLCNPSAQHKKSDQESKIHTLNQAIFLHVQNEWRHHPWKSTYPWKMLFPNFNYACIFWAPRKCNFKPLRTIKRTQWKLSRKRKDRSLSEFRPSRLKQHTREGIR